METLGTLNEQMRRLEQFGDGLKLVWSMVSAASKGVDAVMLAEREFPRQRVADVLKTAINMTDTTTAGGGAELAYAGFTSELVSVLNAGSLLSLPWRRVPFFTRTTKEASPGSAGWVAEGSPIPASRMSTAAITIEQTKIAGFCVFTNELLALWTSKTAAAINAALVNTVGRAVDIALLDPAVAAATGKNPASLTSGLVPIPSPAATEAGFTAAILALLQARVDGGSDLRNVQIIMSPTTALKVSTLLTSGNVRAYPNLGARGGELFGVPVVTTPGAASQGSPTENVCCAVDPTKVLLADDGGVRFSASRAGAMQMDSTPSAPASLVSLFQAESTALKFVRYLNFERSDSSAAGYFTTAF